MNKGKRVFALVAIMLLSLFFTSCKFSKEPSNIDTQPVKQEYNEIKISSPVIQAVAGEECSMVLTEASEIYAWGSSSSGCLGIGEEVPNINPSFIESSEYSDSNYYLIPLKVKLNEKVVEIGTKSYRSYALLDTGELYMWGNNSRGQLGIGNNDDQYTPIKIEINEAIKKVEMGSAHTLALSVNNNLYAWGSNKYGALGDGTTEDKNRPIKIETAEAIIDISAGGGHNLAITESGKLLAWGDNDNWQVANIMDNIIEKPVYIDLNENAIGIEVSKSCSFVILESGKVMSWGSCSYGELGIANTELLKEPTHIPTLTDVKLIESGMSHIVAIANSGNLWSWGWNLFGQTGRKTEEEFIDEPLLLEHDQEFKHISCGNAHTFAITVSGEIYGWGANGVAQLNYWPSKNQYSPVKIEFIS
ncbi:hypothetical protein IMX26_10500 [Clostridium sp. 'deep sea']|uniref:RCC1 domain-containing protein n=1 Tax=Clostridium sp. 'deep sea' TaxID=2779445 RepID=UPI001896553D|nr:hypothetical protein [Clostridium sp. 'deep sea']QOR33921.1 hypothetical protein IMX26_10500 [Clostridium sp. 'deep sea']